MNIVKPYDIINKFIVSNNNIANQTGPTRYTGYTSYTNGMTEYVNKDCHDEYNSSSDDEIMPPV